MPGQLPAKVVLRRTLSRGYGALRSALTLLRLAGRLIWSRGPVEVWFGDSHAQQHNGPLTGMRRTLRPLACS